MRSKWLPAEHVTAAAVVFALADAVAAGPGVAGCVGPSESAGCRAPGDSDGGWPH